MQLTTRLNNLINQSHRPKKREELETLLSEIFTDPFYLTDLEEIEDAVCAFYAVSFEQLSITTIRPQICDAKRLMCYVLYFYKSWTYEEIASRYQTGKQSAYNFCQTFLGFLRHHDRQAREMEQIREILKKPLS